MDTRRKAVECRPMSDFNRVDIPVVVTPEMAANMVDDLKEKGKINIELRTSQAPNIVEQIEWQLENEQMLCELTDDYSSDE